MKIIFDAQIFRQQRYGGISRYFCELATLLSQTPGVTARVIAPNHDNEYLRHMPPGALLGWTQAQGGPLGGVSRLGARLLVRGAMAAVRPDVLHETYYADSWATPKNTVRIMTLHDMIHERFPAQFGQHDTTARDKRLAIARADHIICVSDATRRDAMEILGVPAAKMTVIHHGARLQAAGEAAVVQGAPYLLYVGHRGGYKNFMGLLAAVGASEMLKQLQIVCFGGGPLTPQECERIQALGLDRSRFVMRSGDDQALAALYAGAICFVYPSLYEGFGIPPLEAMSCACPVACSNTSSIPEVVQAAGAYFDPADVYSMRQTLESVVSSPARQAQLRASGIAQAEKYSWDRCAAETLALYRRLTNKESQHD
jgi:glycosyltransferase involved in cell wall biosynthesis